jgi:hypothetical protein
MAEQSKTVCKGCNKDYQLHENICAKCWADEVLRLKTLAASLLKFKKPKTIFVTACTIGDKVGVQVTAPHLPQFIEDSLAKFAIYYLYELGSAAEKNEGQNG